MDSVLTGMVRCKNGYVRLEDGADTYRIDNLISLEINATINKEEIPKLSSMVTQHFITSITYEGTLSAYVNSGIMNRIATYIEARRDVPPLKIVALVNDSTNPVLGVPFSNPSGTSSSTSSKRMYQMVTAEGIIPDSLQLIKVATPDSDVFWQYEMPFTANKVVTKDYFDSGNLLNTLASLRTGAMNL
jgi:hypothetical protein